MQRNYFSKSELTKELEFLTVYNQENFVGYPKEVEEFLADIENVQDVKFQKIYLRRIMDQELGRVERRLLGAYGIDVLRAYNDHLMFKKRQIGL